MSIYRNRKMDYLSRSCGIFLLPHPNHRFSNLFAMATISIRGLDSCAEPHRLTGDATCPYSTSARPFYDGAWLYGGQA